MTSQMLSVGVPREADPDERRVALVPGSIPQLTKAGLQVLVESGAGVQAGITDDDYAARGAILVSSREQLFADAQILLQVRALGAGGAAGTADISRLRHGQLLIAGCEPLWCPQPVAAAAATGATVFALELVPRITRAQSMDILSSMATLAGYRSVLLAALEAPRLFPMLMTAAGTLKPARVLVIGAGVAGLQAIATARRLGAVVLGYDIRPAVREQVESLGARFVQLDVQAANTESAGGYAQQMSEEFYERQRAALQAVLATCDVVITTAAVPGRRSPILVTRQMVEAMPAGAVLVDIAAERGGNCEVTVAGQTIQHHGVSVLGPVNLPSSLPVHASEMFSRNLTTFLLPLIRAGQLHLDLTDEIQRETLVARDGEVVSPRVRDLLGLPPLPQRPATPQTSPSATSPATPD